MEKEKQGLVCGGLSIIVGLLSPVVGLVLGIIGLVRGSKTSYAPAMVCSIVGISLSTVNWVLAIAIMANI